MSCGKITVDGINIQDYSMKELRDKIGFIPQKAMLFTGTIADNIRYGKEDATVIWWSASTFKYSQSDY